MMAMSIFGMERVFSLPFSFSLQQGMDGSRNIIPRPSAQDVTLSFCTYTSFFGFSRYMHAPGDFPSGIFNDEVSSFMYRIPQEERFISTYI